MVLHGDHLMTLDDWLTKHGISNPAFGARIGCTAEAVRKYRNGDRIPDKATMPKIARETEGEVTANDFYALPEAAVELNSAPT